MLTEVDRLRTALASRGRHHAALAARVDARTLPAALVALARELLGDEAWAFVVGHTDVLSVRQYPLTARPRR